MATSSVPERRPDSTKRATTPVRPGRDRFVDVVRAFAILAIVGQHWLLPVSSDGGARPTTGNSLTVLEGWASTLLSPVLPLIFFAGGAAAAGSLHTRRRLAGPTDRPRSWLADCTIRLALPVLPLVAILLPLHHLLVATGTPAQAVHSAAELVGRLAWFLAAYALLVSLTPILVRLHERCRGLELIVMATGAVAAEVVRLVGADGTNWLGRTTVVLSLGAAYQVGIAYSHGRFDRVRRSQMLALSGGALAASVLALGLYALSVITTPGEPSSTMNPPAVALLTLVVAQLSLVLALRDALTRWASYRPVGIMLDWISARTMTIYLWHVPALAVVAGVAIMGYDVSHLFGTGWYSDVPLQLAALTVVLAGFVRAFGHYECSTRNRLARRGSGVGLASIRNHLSAGWDRPRRDGRLDV